MVAVVTIERPARHAVPTRQGRHVVGRPGRVPTATYRRRRVVALVLAAAGIVGTARAAVALGGPIPLAAPEQPPAVTTYVVESGDSLWTVAEEVAPDTDPRWVVDALVEVRGDAPLIPGERITWGG